MRATVGVACLFVVLATTRGQDAVEAGTYTRRVCEDARGLVSAANRRYEELERRVSQDKCFSHLVLPEVYVHVHVCICFCTLGLGVIHSVFVPWPGRLSMRGAGFGMEHVLKEHLTPRRGKTQLHRRSHLTHPDIGPPAPSLRLSPSIP